jgi:LacI family transcriptional regulator
VRTQREDPRVVYLLEHRIPFVTFGRTAQAYDFPYVDEDGELGMQLALEHLIEHGHRRIACLAPPPPLMITTYRLQGYRQTMQAHNRHIDEDLIVYGDLTQRSGYNLAKKLLTQANPPTAIVAGNDLMALGAMSAAQERGLIVGQDVTITGFGNIALAEHAFPPLTTVHQPMHHIGALVCQMLIKVIREEDIAERQIILQPSLVVRQSSGPASRRNNR